eukprot:jgi/Mesvir1/10501/Mv14924-RA.1
MASPAASDRTGQRHLLAHDSPRKIPTWLDDGPQWMYDPETGEKGLRSKLNVDCAERWKRENPGREPHAPTYGCARCHLLKPISSFLPKVGTCHECRRCREMMAGFAAEKDSSLRKAAAAEAGRILQRGIGGGGCRNRPRVGKGFPRVRVRHPPGARALP